MKKIFLLAILLTLVGSSFAVAHYDPSKSQTTPMRINVKKEPMTNPIEETPLTPVDPPKKPAPDQEPVDPVEETKEIPPTPKSEVTTQTASPQPVPISQPDSTTVHSNESHIKLN